MATSLQQCRFCETSPSLNPVTDCNLLEKFLRRSLNQLFHMLDASGADAEYDLQARLIVLHQ